MKSSLTIASFVLVGIALTLGAFFMFNNYVYNEKQAEPVVVSLTHSFEGVVTNVNFEQVMFDGPAFVVVMTEAGETEIIAVPSMGILLCEARSTVADVYAIEVGDRVSALGTRNDEGFVVPCDDVRHYLKVVSTYSNENLGFSFEYKKGGDGYILEIKTVQFDNGNSVETHTLTQTSEYEAREPQTEPGEGPPVIELHVYENTTAEWPLEWIENNPEESLFPLMLSEPEAIVLSGMSGIRYRADGLYVHDVYVVARAGYIYMLRGMYIDTNSPIYRDFQKLITTFSFSPLATQSTRSFSCDEGSTFAVTSYTHNAEIVDVSISDIAYYLHATEVDTGVRYANEDSSVVFLEDDEEALIAMNGVIIMRGCEAV